MIVRHLGAWHHVDGHERVEIQQRREAALLGWQAMGKFWISKDSPARVKKAVFLSLVYNTHLSGGEAWGSLPGGTEAEMERFLVSRMRVLLSGEASTKSYNAEGDLIHCRTITNNEVRFRCGIRACLSSLRLRHLRRISKISA